MIWTLVGVPASELTNPRTAFSTVRLAPAAPIEPESSTMTVIGPPQRLRASRKDGPVALAGSRSPRVVPPAVMLTRLTPPPAPSLLPPPLIVTTIRRALDVASVVASVVPSADSGSATLMTLGGTGVTPGTKLAWGGPSRSWSTTFLRQEPAVHSIRTSS